MKKFVLDTNCFIDAVNESSNAYIPMQQILKMAQEKKITIAVSQHTLNELQKKPDKALELAKLCKIVGHWPIGTWNDQVSTWDKLEGTWDDARQNEVIQKELESLAKSGNSTRDRGAFIDAIRGCYDAFVTSDKQFIADRPKKEINDRFFTKVMTPEEVILSITT